MSEQATRCTVCASPKRHELHRRIWAGLPVTPNAVALGLSKQAAIRHWRNGHVPPDPKSLVSQPLGEADSDAEVRPVDIARAVLADLRAMPTAKMAPRARLDHGAALMKAASEVARYEGSKPSAVTIDEWAAERNSGYTWFMERNSDVGFNWWGSDTTQGLGFRVTALH